MGVGLIGLLLLLADIIHCQDIVLDKTSIPVQEDLRDKTLHSPLLGIFQTEKDIELMKFGKSQGAKLTKKYVWWTSKPGEHFRQCREAETSGVMTKRDIEKMMPPESTSRKKTYKDFLGLRAKRTAFFCCSTLYEFITPVTVEYEGQSYPVYRPSPELFQVYMQGICDPPTSSCHSGHCDTDSTAFAFIAVVDLSLSYWPPIRFLPVEKSNHCFCAS